MNYHSLSKKQLKLKAFNLVVSFLAKRLLPYQRLDFLIKDPCNLKSSHLYFKPIYNARGNSLS